MRKSKKVYMLGNTREGFSFLREKKDAWEALNWVMHGF